jgi:hypothetical protein
MRGFPRNLRIAAGLLWIVAVGCEEPAPPPAGQPSAPVSAKPAAPVASPAVPGPAAPTPDVVREKAAVGMGERGRGYGEGFVATPVKALWRVTEQMAINQIEHDMQLYKASSPDGRGPRTQEEFMEKIIKAGGIRLPPLPPGQRYVYDPATELLMVEQPRQP